MATEPKTRAELDAALANGDQLVLLVVGDGPGFDGIAQNADAAILFSKTQHAIWLRDETVLTDPERVTYKPGDPQWVACALSRPPRVPCAYVARSGALTLNFMDALKDAKARRQPAKTYE